MKVLLKEQELVCGQSAECGGDSLRRTVVVDKRIVKDFRGQGEELLLKVLMTRLLDVLEFLLRELLCLLLQRVLKIPRRHRHMLGLLLQGSLEFAWDDVVDVISFHEMLNSVYDSAVE
jgi:hypothetical protein